MADTTRLVLAHGFTQTGRSWDTFRTHIDPLVPDAETVAVDLPGHGDASDVRTDLWGSARFLVEAGGPATYIGYSMGGRVALHAALGYPDVVERLVVIGATAGIDDPAERAARRADDEGLAERIEQVGVESFVDEWLTNPLFAGLDGESAGRIDRLRNTEAGLASSLRRAGTGTQEPLWDRLGEITVPVLVLAGEDDAKFRRLGARLVDSIPNATMSVVADSGHSTHLEQPATTARLVAAWLSETAGR